MSSPPTKLLLLLAFLALISISHGKLQIISPTDLLENPNYNYGDGILDYVALNPKNTTSSELSFEGNLILAHPNEFACDPIKTIRTYRYDPDSAPVSNPIVIAAWGDCNLAQKVKNAELGGAKMIILVLGPNMPLDHPSLKELSITSSIEVVAMGKKDGDQLVQILKGNRYIRKDNPASIIEMHYSSEPERNIHYPRTQDQAVLDYYFTINDVSKLSYKSLGDVKRLLSEFGSALKFSPHYVIKDTGNLQPNHIDMRCISGGKYCDPNWKASEKKGFKGAPAVFETVRQICLRDLEDQSTPNTYWWKYMNAFVHECIDVTDQDEAFTCYEKAFASAKIPSDIVDTVRICVRDSFGLYSDESIGYILSRGLESSKLKSEVAAVDFMHVSKFPSLFINGKQFKGSLKNQTMVRESILSHFPNNLPPKASTNQSGESPIAAYFGAFIVSVILLDIMLQFMKRRV